jgi:hypothetical protein
MTGNFAVYLFIVFTILALAQSVYWLRESTYPVADRPTPADAEETQDFAAHAA